MEEYYLNRYRIIRKLGEGGSSIAYMARDVMDGRLVTVKRLKEAGTDTDTAPEIAANESKILAMLDNPAIPKLIGEYCDSVVLEYFTGNTLEALLRTKKHLNRKELNKVALELCNIFRYLHERKNPIIYRDLKPSNVIIRPDGHVALIDFGAARVYCRGESADTTNLGTKGYAAPEQYGCLGQTDVKTDIYCFGKTLERMSGGRGSRALLAIIGKCTKPDRDDRFNSFADIERELQRCPAKEMLEKGALIARLTAAAAISALAITLVADNYGSVISYASEDAQSRMPAVAERLSFAGMRLRSILEERFEVELKW